MKLSLSARVAEKFGQQDAASLTFSQFAELASAAGYDAVCIRASLASIHTPLQTVRAMKRQLDALGLQVSMVTGNYEIPHNDDRGPEALRRITPHLDLAEAFGSRLVRVCLKRSEDIAWAQRACDEARERDISLVHQCHPASLFETVEGILEVIRGINRPNFGIIYEAACLHNCGEPDPPGAVPWLAAYIQDVYVQNSRIHPAGGTVIETWARGNVRVDWLPLQEPVDINFVAVFEALRKVGYEGYVTVHQAFGDMLPASEAAQQAYDFLRPLIRSSNTLQH